MRLICPNCGAQYEVPDGVVPQEGRDVQCSNCGNTWFQAHPDNDQPLTDELNPPQVEEPDQSNWSEENDPETEFESDDPDAPNAPEPEADKMADWDTPDDDEDEWQGFDESDAADDTSSDTSYVEDEVDAQDHTTDQAEDHSDAATSDDAGDSETHDGSSDASDDHADDSNTDHDDDTSSDDTSDDGHDADDDPDSAPVEDAVARDLDPTVADILKQEAEHEAQARAADASLESQPDLGLDEAAGDADQRAREASERMARLRGDTPLEESVAATVAASSRRDLLPDIDEINSTLRSTTDRKSGVAEDLYEDDSFETPRKSGRFRRGFWMIILAAIVLLLLYVFAPTIIKALPALEGVMTSYVAMIDSLRGWLDGRVQSGLQWLDTKASTSGE